MKKIIVAICGASGSLYGIRLVRALIDSGVKVYLIVSGAGFQVMAHETGFQGKDIKEYFLENGSADNAKTHLEVLDENDFFTPPASGSFKHDGFVIVPCSMGTLGAISSGISGNLITRAADVALKEKRPLILVPRETPLNLVHLKNMTRAAEAGAVILPPSPGFYNRPETISDLVDSIVGRILDHLDIEHNLYDEWSG